MALKFGLIRIESEDLTYFAASGFTGEKGGIVSLDGTNNPSGISADGPLKAVRYAAAASGAKPIGVLLDDVVSTDVTRYELNRYKREVPQGYKVPILQKGNVVTNMIIGTPAAEDNAYLGASGNFTPTSGTGSKIVGKFVTSKNAAGYAEVRVDL